MSGCGKERNSFATVSRSGQMGHVGKRIENTAREVLGGATRRGFSSSAVPLALARASR